MFFQNLHLQLISLVITTYFINSSLSNGLSSPSQNCSDSEQTFKTFPNVRVYDAAMNVTNYDNNNSVLLDIPVEESEHEESFGWIGVECTHEKPVRWMYDLSFHMNGLEDTYTVTRRDAVDFHNQSTYRYVAETEVKLRFKNQHFVMVCATFDDLCERRVAEIKFNEENERYLLRLLTKKDESDSMLVSEFENALIRSNFLGNVESGDGNCRVNFTMIDYGDTIVHTFQPIGTIDIKPRSVSSGQASENSYLFTEKLSSNCAFHTDCYEDKVSFHNCHNTSKTSIARFWSMVFYMTIPEQNVSRVVRTYHTLTDHRNDSSRGMLKPEWEYSDMRDLLMIEELPKKVAIREPHTELTVNCLLSPGLFSFGTRIGFKFNNATQVSGIVNLLPSNETTEEEEFEAYRSALGSIYFPFDGKERNVTIYCFAPVWNTSEWINVSKQVELTKPNVEVTGKGKYFVLPVNSTFNTTCVATGPPLPELDIIPPLNYTRFNISQSKSLDSIETTIFLANVDESHSGFYNCIATSSIAGSEFYEFEIRVTRQSAGPSNQLLIILVSVFGSLSVLFIIVVVILLVRFRMEKEEFRRLTEEAIREFFDGLDATQHGFPKDKDVDINDHFYANDTVKTLPYDKSYEVPQKQWSFSEELLGTGAFGIVRKGVVEIGSRKSVIAIKTVKSPDDIDNFRATLLELKIMAHIGQHSNVVKLIAASTEEIQNRKVYIGVEFCANGNLLEYLHKRKKLFNNLVQDGQIHFPKKTQPENEAGTYMNLVTSDISTLDLYRWGLQISNAMDFLEFKNVLHADLAARNVLLSENLEAKISDFGLSRELFENSEYTKKTQVALPWKWMAIESLRYLKFSTKSDVWSYGVTLYELFSLGEEPYPGQTWSEEFILTLENGMRLDRPPFCTHNVYNEVMLGCWRTEPAERISFGDAKKFFENAVGLLTCSPRKDDECRDLC